MVAACGLPSYVNGPPVMLTVTGTGITVKLVSAVARDPLLARTVTLPTFTAVIVPLVAIPLVTATMLGSPVTVSLDRKSTRLNSSHGYISYAVFCLKKKKKKQIK